MLVLVTGGCGFIGSQLVPRLLAGGARVRVLDDCSAGDPGRLPAGVELVEADVRDDWAVGRATAGVGAVVHLAARTGVADSLVDPVTSFDVNARGALNVLRAAHDHGVSRVLVGSCGRAVLGAAAVPSDEATVPAPISPFGAAVLAAEGYASAFAGAHGRSVAVLRFSDVHGPGAARGPVAALVRAALAHRPLPVETDGTATVDLLHVEDACAGVVAALGSSATGVFHLATGVETSVRDVAEHVRALTGTTASVDPRPARRGEVARHAARAARAHEAFGFAPAIAWQDGVAAAVEAARGPVRVAA